MKADDLQLDMIPKRTRDGKVVKQGTEVIPGGADTLAWVWPSMGKCK